MIRTIFGILYIIFILGTVSVLAFLKATHHHRSVSTDRIKIALIDTGINYEFFPQEFVCGEFDLTGSDIGDHVGHGTLMAGLITKGLDVNKYCLVIIKWFNRYSSSTDRVEEALGIARSEHVSFVNLSMEGDVPSIAEQNHISALLDAGAKVSVAAGNHHKDLSVMCDVFPACYDKHPNFYVVGSIGANGKIASHSNFGGPVNAFADGVDQCYRGGCSSGTSAATANWTNHLVKEGK